MFEFDLGIPAADKKSVASRWSRQTQNIDVAKQSPSPPELLLDSILPLSSGSHSSVVEYVVEIPTRYAKCFARLDDGRKVGLRDTRQFTGWSGWQRRRSLLFVAGGLRIEVRTDPDDPAGCDAPGNICGLYIESDGSKSSMSRVTANNSSDADKPSASQLRVASNGQNVRKFIALDGRQIILPAWGMTQRIN